MSISGDDALNQHEEAARWLILAQEGELDGEMADAFTAWLADEGNRARFAAVSETWSGLGAVADRPEVAGLQFAAVRYALDRKPSESADPSGEAGDVAVETGRRRRWGWAGWGALVAVAASLILFVFVIPIYGGVQRYATEPAQRLTVNLADGSRVDLDSSTTVTTRFDKNRRAIELVEGRANFKVAKDHLRPFTVTAGDKVFVAKGTQFSVEMVNGDVRAILYEGQVVVLPQPKEAAATAAGRRDKSTPVRSARMNGAPNGALPDVITMAPGDSFIAPVTGSLDLARVEPAADLAITTEWRAGRLAFHNEPLPLAVARMNRSSALKIRLNLAAPNRIRVSGTFEAGMAEAFADGVARLYGLNLRSDGDELILSDQAPRHIN